MTRTLAAEVRKPKLVSRGEKPLPSGGGSSLRLRERRAPLSSANGRIACKANRAEGGTSYCWIFLYEASWS